jgi:hypothetical protein
MTAPPSYRKIEDLESHIGDLVRQKGILESIESYSDDLDFGDVIETRQLIDEEIERLQSQLRSGKPVENGGRSPPPSPSDYVIEHLIPDGKGSLKPLEAEDLDLEKNEGLREAYRMLYSWGKEKEAAK